MVSSNTLAPYYMAGASLSLLAAMFVIYSYIKFKELRKHPSSIIFWRAWFDVAFSLQFIIMYLWDGAQDRCDYFSFIFQFAVLGSQSWYFMIAIDLHRALRNPFTDPASNIKWYHAFVWLSSLLTALLLVTTDNTQFRKGMQVCWSKATDDLQDVNVMNWMVFFVPTLIYYVSSLGIMINAGIRLRQGLAETFKIRRQILVNGWRYVGAFSLYWTVAGIVYLNIYMKERNKSNKDLSPDEDIGLYGTFAFLVAIRGLIDVVVWSRNQQVLPVYRRWWAGRPPQDLLFTDINRALRREVLLYSTRGICKAVENANKHGDVQKPTRVHYPYSLDATPENKNVKRISLERDESDDQEGNVPFFDFAPEVFRYLRSKFGISDDEYMRSIRGDTNAMIEKFTEGRSGSFFYFSEDGKYIVKTLTKGESNFLIEILGYYNEYMVNTPNSLLSKFLGFHAIELYSTTLYFVVMQSVFLTKRRIHQRFDLKGSWVDRHASNPHTKGVLKDSDLNRNLSLTSADREQFLEAVSSDSRFLLSMGIMDYSLLLGIHNVRQRVVDDRRLSQQEREMRAKANGSSVSSANSDHHRGERGGQLEDIELQSVPFFQAHQGGVQAKVIVGPGIYFFGIIDILQEYNTQKKAERCLKVYLRCKDPDGISVVPPIPYSHRFIQAMANITAPMEGDDEVDDEKIVVVPAHKTSLYSRISSNQGGRSAAADHGDDIELGAANPGASRATLIHGGDGDDDDDR